MSIVKTFRKAAVERRKLLLSYECWLEETEKLTDMQVLTSPYTVDAPVTVSTGFPDAAHRHLVCFVGGGVGNTNYVISFVARTDLGQVKRDEIGLVVTP